MEKTLAFLLLDYRTIKPYSTLKNLLIILMVSLLVGFGTGESSVIVGLVMVYGVVFTSYPFAVGEKNAIDMLYSTLSIQRQNVVVGRYLFALSMNLFSGLLAFILSFGISTVLGQAFNPGYVLLIILSCFILFTFVQALQLPIYFKLGYAKAKIAAFMPLIAFPALVVFVSEFLVQREYWGRLLLDAGVWAETHWISAGGLTLLFTLAFFALSAALSIRFYQQRDF